MCFAERLTFGIHYALLIKTTYVVPDRKRLVEEEAMTQFLDFNKFSRGDKLLPRQQVWHSYFSSGLLMNSQVKKTTDVVVVVVYL
jgi:hypothetical protein